MRQVNCHFTVSSILPIKHTMGNAVALAAGLPAGLFLGFVQVADLALKFDEAFMPFARERAGGERGEHRTIFFLTIGREYFCSPNKSYERLFGPGNGKLSGGYQSRRIQT